MLQINIEQMFYVVDEWRESQGEYEKCCHKKPKFNATLEELEKWKQNTYHLYREMDTNWDKVFAMCNIFGFDREKQKRLFSAVRSYNKFCKKNKWQDYPSTETFERLGEWIFETKREYSYEYHKYIVVGNITCNWGMNY